MECCGHILYVNSELVFKFNLQGYNSILHICSVRCMEESQHSLIIQFIWCNFCTFVQCRTSQLPAVFYQCDDLKRSKMSTWDLLPQKTMQSIDKLVFGTCEHFQTSLNFWRPCKSLYVKVFEHGLLECRFWVV